MLNGAFKIRNMFRSMNGAATQMNLCPWSPWAMKKPVSWLVVMKYYPSPLRCHYSHMTPWNFNIRYPKWRLFERIHTFWEAHHIFGILSSKKSRVVVFFCFHPIYVHIKYLTPFISESHPPVPFHHFPRGAPPEPLVPRAPEGPNEEPLEVPIHPTGPKMITTGYVGEGGKKGWGCHDQSPIFFRAPGSWQPHLGWHYTSFSQ